jgi:glycine hydroxymethyltransferase
MTTRGFGPTEAARLGDLIADVMEAPEDEAVLTRVAGEVTDICRRFPVYR